MYLQAAHRGEALAGPHFPYLHAPRAVNFNPCTDAIAVALDTDRADFQPVVAVALVQPERAVGVHIEEAVVVQVADGTGIDGQILRGEGKVAVVQVQLLGQFRKNIDVAVVVEIAAGIFPGT